MLVLLLPGRQRLKGNRLLLRRLLVARSSVQQRLLQLSELSSILLQRRQLLSWHLRLQLLSWRLQVLRWHMQARPRLFHR